MKTQKKRISPSITFRRRKSLFRLKMKVLKKREYHRLSRDIVMPLLTNDDFDNYFVYNVSDFLRRHSLKANSSKWIKNANEFIRLLDKKVHVDASGPRYAHIYQGIDTIVHRVFEELRRLDPFFKFAKLRQTGSISSNVKVGLPHEADYTLEIPRDKKLNNGKSLDGETFIAMVKYIVKENASDLTKEFSHWVLYGVKEHENIGGVCLVMACKPNDSSSDSVGVTVDVVPVFYLYHYSSVRTT